jgi:hypothetical protein
VTDGPISFIREINEAQLVAEVTHPRPTSSSAPSSMHSATGPVVIAAGFEGGEPKRLTQPYTRHRTADDFDGVPRQAYRETAADGWQPSTRTLVLDDSSDDLDVPDFLK